jgi:hypothetical protein
MIQKWILGIAFEPIFHIVAIAAVKKAVCLFAKFRFFSVIHDGELLYTIEPPLVSFESSLRGGLKASYSLIPNLRNSTPLGYIFLRFIHEHLLFNKQNTIFYVLLVKQDSIFKRDKIIPPQKTLLDLDYSTIQAMLLGKKQMVLI